MKKLLLALTLLLTLTACASPTLPTATAMVDTGVDPDIWASVPAGSFLYGLHEENADIPYDFEMMITHVTNAQFASYLNQAIGSGELKITDGQVVGYYAGDPFSGKKHEEPVEDGDWLHYPINVEGSRITFDGSTFAPMSGYENHPVTMVTWFGAKAYCEARGGRLPSELEWEKAARGANDNRAYPWGNELARNQANYYSSQDIFEKVIGKGGDTTPVGFYNNKTYDGYATLDNASPYGIYDMAGNVWQWTGDVVTGIHYRYLRGGSKLDYGYNLRIWTRNNVRPDYESPNIGFRCARGGAGQ